MANHFGMCRFPIILALGLSPAIVVAASIKFNPSYLSSDQFITCLSPARPVIETADRAGQGAPKIEVYQGTTLREVQKDLPRPVLDGGADTAFISREQNAKWLVTTPK